MSDFTPYDWLWIAGLAVSVPIFILLFYITAPFGRHTRKNFGPMMNNTLGWVLMESPALFWFGYWVLSGTSEKTLPVWIMFGLWMMHYLNRTLIYPFRLPNKKKQMPVLIAAFAFIFQLWNGYLNGSWLGTHGDYGGEWMSDPRFLAGIGLFITGFLINLQSDEILLNLRKPGETAYKIPRGGLYKYVSSPNYLGEIIEWTGWALMSWSFAGLFFAIWTIANLLPRALSHHKWYQDKFPDYPSDRKALFPFLW